MKKNYPLRALIRSARLAPRITLCIKLVALTIPLLTVIACANRNPNFETLTNQGLLPVSRENPYVGSNLYLAREMEGSTYLYNFMGKRGIPQAIEIVGTSESSAEMRMFYSDRSEVYHANPIKDNQFNTSEWLIRGPYQLDRTYYKQVSELSSPPGAQFEIWGRRETIGGPQIVATERVIIPVFVPTPTPIPTPKRRARKPATPGSGPAIGGVIVAGQKGALNFDQLALLESKEFVERSPNGDAIHLVKSTSETITSISNWYTGSSDNTKKIADKNNLPVDAKLNPGTKIFLQGELVINSKIMK